MSSSRSETAEKPRRKAQAYESEPEVEESASEPSPPPRRRQMQRKKKQPQQGGGGPLDVAGLDGVGNAGGSAAIGFECDGSASDGSGAGDVLAPTWPFCCGSGGPATPVRPAIERRPGGRTRS